MRSSAGVSLYSALTGTIGRPPQQYTSFSLTTNSESSTINRYWLARDSCCTLLRAIVCGALRERI